MKQTLENLTLFDGTLGGAIKVPSPPNPTGNHSSMLYCLKKALFFFDNPTLGCDFLWDLGLCPSSALADPRFSCSISNWRLYGNLLISNAIRLFWSSSEGSASLQMLVALIHCSTAYSTSPISPGLLIYFFVDPLSLCNDILAVIFFIFRYL